MSDVRPDGIIDRYQIQQHTGSSPQSEFYTAHDLRGQRDVLLQQFHLNSEQQLDNFKRMAAFLEDAPHQALPRVIDYIIREVDQFLVMLLLPELKDIEPEPSNVAKVLDWADTLLEDLSHLHQQGLLHLDIEPKNLKLKEDGGIMLLGLKPVMPLKTSESPYASPEQIKKDGNIDAHSDLYSLAATLYYLLTDTEPVTAQQRSEVIARSQADPLDGDLAAQTQIPSDVREVLKKALELDPDRRYHSAAEMHEALQEARQPLPPEPPPPTPVPVPAWIRWVCNPIAAIPAVLVILLVGGILGYLWRGPRTPEPLSSTLPSASTTPSSPSAALPTTQVMPTPQEPLVPLPDAQSSLTEKIIYRPEQKLICGVAGDSPGFSKFEGMRKISETISETNYSGMDADFCRAVALAIFSDTEKVRFASPVDPLFKIDDYFKAIRQGDVDVVFASTTASYNSDIGKGVDFGPVTFHDRQRVMVSNTMTKTLKVDVENRLLDLNNLVGYPHSVCMKKNTTSPLNVADIFTDTARFTNTVQQYSTFEEAVRANNCVAIIGSGAELEQLQKTSPLPGTRTITDPIILDLPNPPRDPRGPIYKENDPRWAEVINWVVNCTIAGEELGVDQVSVTKILTSTASITDTTEKKRIEQLKNDPRVQRLLGLAGARLISSNIGLPPDFCRLIIKNVGNYKDIYVRNLIANKTRIQDLNELKWEKGDRIILLEDRKNGDIIEPDRNNQVKLFTDEQIAQVCNAEPKKLCDLQTKRADADLDSRIAQAVSQIRGPNKAWNAGGGGQLYAPLFR